jgi:predicted solute-binding protein
MKLYTEEQVKAMIEKSQYTGLTADFLILAAPSVQLPSDEEIEKESFDLYANHNTYSLNVRQYKAFKRGAKWMSNKIQGGEQ